jgi:hypothetical protein
MGWDPGKSLIRRAIDGPRQKSPRARLLRGADGALSSRAPAEQPEHGRPAAGHGGVKGARFLERVDNPLDLRMMRGDGTLQIVWRIHWRT